MSPKTKESAEEPTVHRRPTELTVIAVRTGGISVHMDTESATAPNKDRVATNYGKSYDPHKDPRP